MFDVSLIRMEVNTTFRIYEYLKSTKTNNYAPHTQILIHFSIRMPIKTSTAFFVHDEEGRVSERCTDFVSRNIKQFLHERPLSVRPLSVAMTIVPWF